MNKDEKYGRLTAIKNAHNGKGGWEFSCDCGNKKIISTYNVRNGSTKSCGCLHLERCSQGLNRLKHGDARKGSVLRLHNIWRDISKRCYSVNTKVYKDYGKRNISMCNEWRNNYTHFKIWSLDNGYKEDLTLDRIDNDGNYEPDNCRWATRKTQARNRRTSKHIVLNGESKTVADWADILKEPYAKVYYKYVTKQGRTEQ